MTVIAMMPMKTMAADGAWMHLMKFDPMAGVVRDQDVLVIARPRMSSVQACAQKRETESN
jgi:hypothetical protein